MITEYQITKSIVSDSNLSVSTFNITEYPLPSPFIPPDKEKIKAFVLGADPSNFSINGKETRKISCVFDIGNDKRYFSSINQNLIQIGLSQDNVYVQNMVRNYMDKETQHNPKWNLFADKWLPYIKQEFDSIDPLRKIPVFVTAEIVIKFLLHNSSNLGRALSYYSATKKIPIEPSENKLERNTIPFYRHKEYSLKKQILYRDKIREILSRL